MKFKNLHKGRKYAYANVYILVFCFKSSSSQYILQYLGQVLIMLATSTSVCQGPFTPLTASKSHQCIHHQNCNNHIIMGLWGRKCHSGQTYISCVTVRGADHPKQTKAQLLRGITRPLRLQGSSGQTFIGCVWTHLI